MKESCCCEVIYHLKLFSPDGFCKSASNLKDSLNLQSGSDGFRTEVLQVHNLHTDLSLLFFTGFRGQEEKELHIHHIFLFSDEGKPNCLVLIQYRANTGSEPPPSTRLFQLVSGFIIKTTYLIKRSGQQNIS